MKNVDKQILKFVRQGRDRIHISKILDIIVKSLFLSLCLSFTLAILSRFIPIYNPYGKAAILTAIIALGGFIISLFMTPKDETAALLIDSKGLSERTITALEFIGDDSEISYIQKNDALNYLKKFNIKDEIKIKLPRRTLQLCAIMMVLVIISGFIPNPTRERAEELYNIKKQIKEQEKEAEELIKKVEDNKRLGLEQKKEAIKQLKDLKKELRQSKDINEAEKAIKRTENKINMLKEKYSDKDMDNIIDVFNKHEITKNLSQTLKEGNKDKLKKDLEETIKELKDLSEEDIKDLAKDLEELAQALKENVELSDAIYQLSQMMADGNLGDIDEQLDALSNEIAKLMENSEFQKSMNDVMEQLQNSCCQNSIQGQPQSQSQGEGQGEGQGQSQGQGGGTGSGAGSGADSKGGNTNSQSGNSGLGSKGTTSHGMKEYEKIFAPDLLGGEGEKDILKGNKGEGGQSKIYKTEQGMTIKGEMLPYNQVLGEYREQAFQNIEGSSIPQGMQGIVKDYFTSLGE